MEKVKFLNARSCVILTDSQGQCAYRNSQAGRKMLQNDVSAETLATVLGIWGDAPIVPDMDVPDTAPPGASSGADPVETIATLQRQVTDLQAQMAALTGGEG